MIFQNYYLFDLIMLGFIYVGYAGILMRPFSQFSWILKVIFLVGFLSEIVDYLKSYD
jgi:hypothetical protein